MKITNDIIEKLQKKDYTVVHFASSDEAKQYVLSSIAEGKSIGFGGSVTVDSLHLYEELQQKGHPVFWHWKTGVEARTPAMTAEVFLCSVNAMDSEGNLYNIDGTGNRVGALCFGPKEVFLIVGSNKLVDGGEKEAIDRIKTEACGKNARRLNLNTYCAQFDKCVGSSGCDSKQRMCKVFQKLEKQPNGRIFHIVLVDEPLGY